MLGMRTYAGIPAGPAACMDGCCVHLNALGQGNRKPCVAQACTTETRLCVSFHSPTDRQHSSASASICCGGDPRPHAAQFVKPVDAQALVLWWKAEKNEHLSEVTSSGIRARAGQCGTFLKGLNLPRLPNLLPMSLLATLLLPAAIRAVGRIIAGDSTPAS